MYVDPSFNMNAYLIFFQEDEVLLCRTLYGVMRNISHLCARKVSRTWGPDSWKKVRIFVTFDVIVWIHFSKQGGCVHRRGRPKEGAS